MTLLEKIDIVLKKYNNGEDNEYSNTMKSIIDSVQYAYLDQFVVIDDIGQSWCIDELIGYCVRNNNPDLFETKDTNN